MLFSNRPVCALAACVVLCALLAAGRVHAVSSATVRLAGVLAVLPPLKRTDTLPEHGVARSPSFISALRRMHRARAGLRHDARFPPVAIIESLPETPPPSCAPPRRPPPPPPPVALAFVHEPVMLRGNMSRPLQNKTFLQRLPHDISAIDLFL